MKSNQQTGDPPAAVQEPTKQRRKNAKLPHGITTVRQGDGTEVYKLSWDLPRSENGTRRRRAKTLRRGTTLAAAKAQLRDILRSVDDGTYIEPTQQTAIAYLEEWRQSRFAAGQAGLEGGIEPTTAQRMAINIEQLRPALGNILLQRVDRTVARKVVASLCAPRENGKKLAPNTVRLAVAFAKSAFAVAVHEGRIKANPWVGIALPKVQRDVDAPVKALDADEVADLLRKLEPYPADYALARVAFGTGCRRGELMALRWSDIDWTRGAIRVRRTLIKTKSGGLVERSGAKTTGSLRDVPVTPALLEFLRSYRKRCAEDVLRFGSRGDWDEEGALLFPESMIYPKRLANPDAVALRFARAAKRVGHPGVHLHMARHTWASLLLVAGARLEVVAERLGHSSVLTTQRTYLHAIKRADEAATSLAAQLGL